MRVDDIDLTDLDRFVDGFPHDVFTFLRREAPVWFHPPTAHTPGGEGFWVVSTHAECLAAAADAATFSSDTGPGRDGGGTLIEDLPSGFAAGVLLNMMDDPRHQQIRRLLTPAVSPRALAALEDALRARAAAIVDAAAASPAGGCDLVVDIAAELPLQAIAHLLGVPQDDRHLLFGWANATLDHDDRDLGEATERTQAASAAMFDYGTRLIERARAAVAAGTPGADMLARVVRSTDPQLTDLELQMFFNLLIAAGSETTRNSLTLGVLALAERPDQWRALADDRALLPSAADEILRWASTTPYNRRTATVDTELGGRRIAAGDKVTLWWASANHDEAVFAAPSPSTSAAPPTRTSPSGTGRTSAWAPRWPAPRSASCSTPCSTGSRRSGPPARSSGPAATSTPASATPR